MGSLAAVADNDTYFFSKVDYGVRCSNSRWILVSDNFNWQDFFPVWGGETEAKIGCFADGNWQE